MNIIRKSYILMAAVLGILVLKADFENVSIWTRLSDKGNMQTLVLCGDKHDLMDTGIDQSAEITDFLSVRNSKNDYIIVEDLHDIEGFGKRVNAFFDAYPNEADREKAQRGTSGVYKAFEEARKKCVETREHDVLLVLPYLARQKNISVVDIDFRAFVSCGAMRFNVEEYENGRLMIPHLLESMVQEIAAYDDGAVLNKKYAEIVERYTPFMHYICKIMRDQNIIFQDLIAYLVDICLENPQTFNPVFVKSIRTVDLSWDFHQLQLTLDKAKKGDTSEQVQADLRSNFEALLNFSSAELIDAMALHALYTKQVAVAESNVVFVCAGEAHNAIVAHELAGLGYTLVNQVVDEYGVDMAGICASLVSKGKPVATVWSYVTDAIGSVVEYVTELFA